VANVITLFYEHGQCIGSMQTEDFIHVSTVFVCPYCGTAWGKRFVKVDNVFIRYIAETRHCSSHGNGRMISPFDPIEALPEAVMAREIYYGVQEWLKQ